MTPPSAGQTAQTNPDDHDSCVDEDWPVFVISLKSATLRRAPLVAKLDRFGIPFVVHEAIDGLAGLPEEYEALIDRAHVEAVQRRRITDGEWACALSHRAIYGRVAERALPGAVVLEDDARIGRRLATFLEGRGYSGHDLVLLDHHIAKFRLRSARRAPGPCLLLEFRKNPVLTTGYAISRRGAEYLLSQSAPLRGLADWPCDITALGAVGAVPRLVGHPPFISSNSHIKAERAAAVREAKKEGTLGRFE